MAEVSGQQALLSSKIRTAAEGIGDTHASQIDDDLIAGPYRSGTNDDPDLIKKTSRK